MFIIAPLIGAALAAGAYGAIRGAKVPITTREAEEALGKRAKRKRSSGSQTDCLAQSALNMERMGEVRPRISP